MPLKVFLSYLLPSSYTFTFCCAQEGGEEEPVTFNNREEYVERVVKVRLAEGAKQVGAMRRGIAQVLPAGPLSLLTWQEARDLLCGAEEINIDLLRAHTRHVGWDADDQTVQWLWQILSEFSDRERAQFVRFFSGRERLPQDIGAEEELMVVSRQHGSASLPKASTCFNTLYLPAYASQEELREKLLLAITSCQDIDTDFRVRDDSDFYRGDEDESDDSEENTDDWILHSGDVENENEDDEDES